MIGFAVFIVVMSAALVITGRALIQEERHRTYVNPYFCRNCREHIKEMRK